MLLYYTLFRLSSSIKDRADVLCKEFVVESKRKDEPRQHIGQVAAHPVLHLETSPVLTSLLFCQPQP